jgi:hypothetical protein
MLCRCCGPCCVVGRFIVRECEGEALVEGATVTVKADSEGEATITSGVTTDTGTVALVLPERGGRRYIAEVTLPDGPLDENGDPTLSTTRKKFVARCGVNEINIAFRSIQKVCVTVVDSETNTPIEGIEVELSAARSSGAGEKVLESGTTGSDGRVCLDMDHGGMLGIRANGGGPGVIAGLSPGRNPDYGTGYVEANVPNCEDYEIEMELGLIANYPGCYKIVLWGCWCGWPGVSITVKGKVRRNVSPIDSCSMLIGTVEEWDAQESWQETFTTDATGRAWVCSGEGHTAPFFGNQYNPATDQYECWVITGIRIDPPSPFEWQEWNFLVPGYGQVGGPGPAIGNPGSDAGIHPNNSGWFIQMFTPGRLIHLGDPDGPFYFCGRNCLALIPETVTVEFEPDDPLVWPGNLSGALTLTNPPDQWFNPTYYEACFPEAPTTSVVVSLQIAYSTFDCGDFDAVNAGGGARAWLRIQRVFNPCDFDPEDFNGSETIMDMIAVSGGTTACPISFDMEEWKLVLIGPPWQYVRAPITVRAGVTG